MFYDLCLQCGLPREAHGPRCITFTSMDSLKETGRRTDIEVRAYLIALNTSWRGNYGHGKTNYAGKNRVSGTGAC